MKLTPAAIAQQAALALAAAVVVALGGELAGTPAIKPGSRAQP